MSNEDAELPVNDDASLEPQAIVTREKPDGELDPAGEAGWYLQQEREARGETIEFASEMTGVHPYHIEAIEFGDMTAMPERMEALEMIGVYAIYLGFDPEPLLHHYVRFLPRPEVAPACVHPANPAPLSSAKVLSFSKLPKLPKFKFKLARIPGGTGGIAAAIAGALFLISGTALLLLPDEAATLASEQAAVDPMPTASTESEEATIKITEAPAPEEQPVVEAELGVDETEGTGLDGLAALIQEKVKPARGQPEPPVPDQMARTEGREYGEASAKTRLVLKAKANVWMRVEDAAGNVVMTQMLMQGDTYHVPDREGLVVIARDGGLLSYVIDGEEKGVLGTPGEILVGRPLDIKSLAGNG